MFLLPLGVLRSLTANSTSPKIDRGPLRCASRTDFLRIVRRRGKKVPHFFVVVKTRCRCYCWPGMDRHVRSEVFHETILAKFIKICAAASAVAFLPLSSAKPIWECLARVRRSLRVRNIFRDLPFSRVHLQLSSSRASKSQPERVWVLPALKEARGPKRLHHVGPRALLRSLFMLVFVFAC
jgi:hypothetical protein